MGGAGSTYGERKGSYRILVGRPVGRRPFGRPRLRWGIICKWIFKKWVGDTWTGLFWLRRGTGGGRLRMRQRIIGFHKMRRSLVRPFKEGSAAWSELQ